MRTSTKILAGLAVLLASLAVTPAAANAASGGDTSTKAKAEAVAALIARAESAAKAHAAQSGQPTQGARAAQVAPGVTAPSSWGIEEAWPWSHREGPCGGYATGTQAYNNDYVRAGITSGSTQGDSHVWWLGAGQGNSIHLEDSFSVSGAATYWNSPGGSWWVVGATIGYDHDISGYWQNNHTYSLSYTGFLAYYSHSTYGNVYANGDSCSINTGTSAWF